MVQNKPKAPARQPVQPFSRSSRFGDEPTPNARQGKLRSYRSATVGLLSEGAAPVHSTLGNPYQPLPAGDDRVGSASTFVESWGYSTKAQVPRVPPHQLDKVAPGAYLGREHPYDLPGANALISLGGDRLEKPRIPETIDAGLVMFPPSVGPQNITRMRNSTSSSFAGAKGHPSERRLAPLSRGLLSKEEGAASADLLRKLKRGSANGRMPQLSTAELQSLQRSASCGVEPGGYTTEQFMPASQFDKAGSLRKSASFAFDGSTTTKRWELPDTTPGPGDYEIDRGFDGRGVQKLSQSASTPCVHMQGKKPWTQSVGLPDDIPAPTAYFPQEDSRAKKS